jgi:VWFA-related protein
MRTPPGTVSILVVGALALFAPSDLARQQTPLFRSQTGVIAVDVQVTDSSGGPIPSLMAKDFDISIDGKHRSVVTAELMGTSASASGRAAGTPDAPAAPAQAASAGTGRTFMLAIDGLSFSADLSKGVVEAGRRFISQLAPNDSVGLFAYPLGPRVDPTTDHAKVAHALDGVAGQRSDIGLEATSVSASQLIDWFADENARLDIIFSRCGGKRNGKTVTEPPDPNCQTQMETDMSARAGIYETEARSSLEMLGALFDGVAKIEGRKYVVLLSAGMPLGTRPGSRPDVGQLPVDIGERAARANAILYTLFIDHSFFEQFAAENRRASTSVLARDKATLMAWLDQFSGTAGGELLQVQVGNGDTAFSRVLRETSTFYLLGVQMQDSDRDGREHRIAVKVNQRGARVQARQWVTVPRPPAT